MWYFHFTNDGEDSSRINSTLKEGKTLDSVFKKINLSCCDFFFLVQPTMVFYHFAALPLVADYLVIALCCMPD